MNIRRMITGTLAFVLIAVLFAGYVTASAEDPVRDAAERFRRESRCRDLSIAVYDHGKIEYYGDKDALYQIGSMTKAFTGLAVQKLIDEGLIDEEEVLSDLIPGFEAYYGSEKADIRIKDLLEQKSGYTNNEKKYPSADESMTLSEWAATVSGKELSSRPGTEYAYSNVNYNLLGLVIEKAGGSGYREYMQKEILDPLGLHNTFIGTPADSRIVEGTRLIYRNVCEFKISVKEASIPAGYFYSNAEDMSRWIEIWTGNADIPSEMEACLDKVKSRLVSTGDYYSGWEKFEGDVIGHSGGTPNYSSRIVFSEDKQTGVCVLTNLNVAATTDSLCNGVYNIVTDSAPVTIQEDVWTVFDKIFTCVTIAGIGLVIIGISIRKRKILIISDVLLILLFILVMVLFPMIFGAGLYEIVFTWAPWSLAGGLLMIIANIIVISLKLLTGTVHADHNETG